jgi:ectoine hydroxylase-related dioxygenase (phytanoyl-CoA dioxygenase family)
MPTVNLFNYWVWQSIPEFEEFILESDLAQSIAQLLQTEHIFNAARGRKTAFYDTLFRREAGSTNAAVWHHDEPYFDFFDGRKCVVWFPLEPASSDAGLTLIGGSQQWGNCIWRKLRPEKALRRGYE